MNKISGLSYTIRKNTCKGRRILIFNESDHLLQKN